MFPLLALLILSSSVSSAEPTGSIEGRVINKTNEQGIRRAQVRLYFIGESTPGKDLAAYTDEEGRFRLANLPPGRYRLRVEKTGFLAQDVVKTGGGRGAVLEVQPNSQVTGVVVRLLQTSTIAGRVRDQVGDAMPHVSIEALQQTFDLETGKPRWTPAGANSTNDLGDYRVFGLKPGKYYLRINPNRQNEIDTYTPLYHPGVPELERATLLDVKPGASLEGFDFSLTPVHAVSVRGRLTNLRPAPKGRLQASVTLFGRSETGMRSPLHSSPVTPAGEFELRGVVPGAYLLHGMEYGQESQTQALESLDVGNADVEGITLTLAEGGSITGAIHFEGQPAARRPPIGLRSRESDVPQGRQFVQLQDDGSFSFKNVLPGLYDFQTSPNEGFYLKAVRVAGRDLTEAGLRVPAGGSVSEIEVVMAKAEAKVQGVIRDGDQPAPEAMVILLAAEPRRPGVPVIRQAFSDAQGNFTLDQVVAGSYQLFAVEGLEVFRAIDPEVRKNFADRVETIEVKDKASVQKDLKLIPAEEK